MRAAILSMLVLLGACDLQVSGAGDPESTIFSWRMGEHKDLALRFEFRESGWRNVRNIYIVTKRGSEESTDVLAYWVCNRDTLIFPSEYTDLSPERRTELGAKSSAGAEISLGRFLSGTAIGPYFAMERTDATKFLDALNKPCRQVPTVSEPPVNILMSYMETGKLTHFEASGFVRNGAVVSAWERHEDFETIHAGSPEGKYAGILPHSEGVMVLTNPTPKAKGLVQYDCSNRGLERQSLVLFNLDGSHSDTLNGGLKIDHVVPGTTDEANLDTVCLFD